MPFCLEIRNLGKTYGAGHRTVEALKNVSFNVQEGQFVSLMGPSGSGKTTLLNLLGGMDTPTSGEVRFQGEALSTLGDERLTQIRRESVGFLFQQFHLMPTLNVLENVALPLWLSGENRAKAAGRAAEFLDKVGIASLAEKNPRELSAGEQQRVSLARALAPQPKLILADEPTGNLDGNSGAALLKTLRELTARDGQTVVLATHSREAADLGDTVILIRDGQLTGVYPVGVVRT